jgi:hypothetical protein
MDDDAYESSYLFVKDIDDIERSRSYMSIHRSQGFKHEELKLYWNVEQIENLCSRDDAPRSHDPSDIDAIDNIRQHPVAQRNHRGTITYVHAGIEQAVFDVPSTAQIILLNFAVRLDKQCPSSLSSST